MVRSLFVVAVVALGLTACEPTGAARCETVTVSQWAQIEAAGWRLDCTPGFPAQGTYDNGTTWFPIRGWADVARRTVWLWEELLPDDTALRKVAQHELGHVLHPDWDERTVDGWAWCTDPQPAYGYEWQPTPTECRTLTAA